MNISVGVGPNFVMRLGQMEINHGCKVRTGSTVTSTLSFPEALREGSRIHLVEQFTEFLIHFWMGRVL